jgi:uncharacterized BrkB/YihY/UPF0761 family membrane protein
MSLGSLYERGKAGVKTWTDRAADFLEAQRPRRGVIDLVARFYERDREGVQSVLGSAIALRLFLFVIPVIIALVGFLNTAGFENYLERSLDESKTTGQVASSIYEASDTSGSSGIVLLITGLFLTMWAGRSLAKVVVASSANAWAIPTSERKTTLRVIGLLTGLLVAMLLVGVVVGRVRSLGGVAATTVSLAASASMIAVVWFIIAWALPNSTPDPGAQLPGAALMGVGLASVQWFMQGYLPDKIARSSEIMGSLAFTVASLGYFFIIGRLITLSFVTNAVLYERFGSLSELLFALPVIRRIPHRWPIVARFFDLKVESDASSAPPRAP